MSVSSHAADHFCSHERCPACRGVHGRVPEFARVSSMGFEFLTGMKVRELLNAL